MLHIIKGDVGSGKTTYITELISRAIGEKKRCFLIVPEQQTVSAERFMAEKLHPSFPLYLEITNFSRLANTVFRTYGGISYNYSSEAVRSLIMWKTLGELLPCLHENKSDIEAGRVKRMLSAISELHSASVSAEDLKKAIDSTKEERLKEKLEDLYLISTLYTSLLKEHYSDQSEDLDRLSDVLAENDFFSDAIVVIDSFTSFTPQEYKVISAIMRQCELFVTLTLPSESERSACFEEIERAKNSLKSCAMNNRIALDEVKLGESKRNPSPLMRYVAKNMTSPIAKQLKRYESEEKKGEALRIIECPDPYTEADFVAFDIKRRVQAGARYRDFSVFARTASSYEGILDSALKKYNIPYFMSVRSDISSFAPIKMICSAYSVIASNFNRSDLITYMKCSLSGISEKDCDDFEIYTKKWNVNGNRFIDGIDWNMSPQGYVSKKDDRYADFLIRINETKKKLISPLESLYTFASENHTVKEHCRALFEFLQSISLEKQLYELAEREEKEGNLQESDNYRRIFSVICETLDLLCDTLPDTVLNAEGFSSLLRIVFSETNIGQIPAQLDAVTVGSADMLRAESEHIYLFGVNAGEFPATVSDNSFFSQSDRATLCALGLELENDLSEKASRESFCIYRAFASAKNSVTLLYSLLSASYTAQTPSAVIENIKHLAGDFVSLTRYDAIKEMDKLWDRDSSFEMLGKISDGAEKRALFDILSEDEDYERRLSTLKKPITTNNALLSSDTSKIIYPSDVNMTSSRIEKYAKCAFSYYCDYIMSLKAHDDIKIDFLSIGNLVHSILENLFLYLEKHGKEIFELEKEELEEVVSQITSAYVSDITPYGFEHTPRMKHLFKRLYRAVLTLVENIKKEFSNSEFKPRFFELEIGERDISTPSPITFESKNGTKITLYGKIDRVDTYERDGNVYVRVVDYKTGSKDFSLDTLDYGINMQMLIYLFSIWKTENELFKKRLGRKDEGEIIPAGVLYMTASVDDARSDSLDEAEIEKATDKKFSRSGLFLNDESILRAMDREFKYIPIKLTKAGELSPKKALASASDFGEILKKIEDVLSTLCDEMKAGRIDAVPVNTPKIASPCTYCNLRPICRQKAVKKKGF